MANPNDPRGAFDQDLSEMSPSAAHDTWEDVTNLQADELRELRDTQRNEEYLDVASSKREQDDGPIPGGPLDDAIHLAETPASEWGPDERAEAAEAVNFIDRQMSQFEEEEGEPLLPNEAPRVHKRELALMRWGFDAEPDDSFP